MKNKTSKSSQVPIGGIPAPLKHIESATLEFAARRHETAKVVENITAQIRQIRATAPITLRRYIDDEAIAKAALHDLIDAHRDCFEKPRTRIFDDIKVGLSKQKGETIIRDADQTIALIEKHFPDRLDNLAPSTRTLSKKALSNLTATELKKIGVEITGDTYEVLIKPQKSDLEDSVAALLEDTEEHLKAAA
jgi:hypothetical protein